MCFSKRKELKGVFFTNLWENICMPLTIVIKSIAKQTDNALHWKTLNFHLYEKEVIWKLLVTYRHNYWDLGNRLVISLTNKELWDSFSIHLVIDDDFFNEKLLQSEKIYTLHGGWLLGFYNLFFSRDLCQMLLATTFTATFM